MEKRHWIVQVGLLFSLCLLDQGLKSYQVISEEQVQHSKCHRMLVFTQGEEQHDELETEEDKADIT